jgi:hypothetical protein
MYYTNDPTANPIVWTQIVAGLSMTTPASFEVYANKCFFAEGTVYASWDGAAYLTYAGAPLGTFLRVWKDAMWVSGVAGLPDRLYESTAGDATTFPAAQWVDILHGDGDFVSALFSDGLFLGVGKKRRTQVVYDPGLLANRTADFEKGVESHFGVVHMEDKLYYLSRLGVCWWQGDASARLISYKIDPLFRGELINLGALSSVYAYQLNDRCGWAIPEAGSSIPTIVIEYYPRLGPIYQISGNIGPGPWTFQRLPATCFATYRSGGVERVLGGNANGNSMLWVYGSVGTDDGQLFTSTVETGAYNLGDPINWKYLRRVKLIGRGKFYFQLKRNFQTALYKTYLIDLTGSSDNWGTSNWNDPGKTWGPDSYLKELIQNLDAFGRVFTIVLTDSETTTGFLNIPVGSKNTEVPAGEWQFLECVMDGDQLGLRG